MGKSYHEERCLLCMEKRGLNRICLAGIVDPGRGGAGWEIFDACVQECNTSMYKEDQERRDDSISYDERAFFHLTHTNQCRVRRISLSNSTRALASKVARSDHFARAP